VGFATKGLAVAAAPVLGAACASSRRLFIVAAVGLSSSSSRSVGSVISQLAVGADPMHLDTTSIALACEVRSAYECVCVCVCGGGGG
jgi:hypothetical protein